MALTHLLISTQSKTQRHMPRPQSAQVTFLSAKKTAGTSRSEQEGMKELPAREVRTREVVLCQNDAFIGLWFEDQNGLSIDSSTYINRLEPKYHRSGDRRRLAAISS